MIFSIAFPESRPVAVQIVQNRAWVANGTIDAEIWPLKKNSNGSTDGMGLPYKNSHKIFTLGSLSLNMRVIDGTNTYLVSEPQNWGSHMEAFLSLIIMEDSVKIQRQQKTGSSPSGAPSTSLPVINASLPCYIIPDEGNVIVSTAGQTAIVTMKLYCDMTDIRENDVITDLNTGSKYKVINVKQFTQVCYTACTLQGGVI